MSYRELDQPIMETAYPKFCTEPHYSSSLSYPRSETANDELPSTLSYRLFSPSAIMFSCGRARKKNILFSFNYFVEGDSTGDNTLSFEYTIPYWFHDTYTLYIGNIFMTVIVTKQNDQILHQSVVGSRSVKSPFSHPL